MNKIYTTIQVPAVCIHIQMGKQYYIYIYKPFLFTDNMKFHQNLKIDFFYHNTFSYYIYEKVKGWFRLIISGHINKIFLIQSVPGGKVSIRGGHSIGHSKQKKKNMCTCVLFQIASEIELFHCTVPKLWIRKRYYILFLIPVFTVQVSTVYLA
jgi:hypothetical protein